jgi:hypothetical protein
MLQAVDMDIDTIVSKIQNLKREISNIKKENPDWKNCSLSIVMISELNQDLKELIIVRNCLEKVEENDEKKY